MKIRFYNIDWITDGEDVDLPNETILKVDDHVDLITEGADVLSDVYGWCIWGFDFEKLPDNL